MARGIWRRPHIGVGPPYSGEVFGVGLLDRSDGQIFLAVFFAHRAFDLNALGDERNELFILVLGVVAFNRINGAGAVFENRHLIAALGARQGAILVLFALLAALVIARLIDDLALERHLF